MEGTRVHLGEELPLLVLCKDGSQVPTAPDAAPTYTIYDANGVEVTGADTIAMPPVDREVVDGLFGCGHFVGVNFSEGYYTVLYKWTISAAPFSHSEEFEVMPGGDGGGNNIAMGVLRKPHTTYVVRQLTSGKLAAGRNPRV